MRFLKYINWLIAFLLVTACGAIYWYVYRALPQVSGQVAAPVSAPVTIGRDEWGVPHIQAANLDDLFFAQGYVTAQDRLFQLEFTRRRAAGELAELFGTRGLESDLEARRFRMRRLAEFYAARVPDQDRPALVAYARGVNYFIETHAGQLPVEFRALNFDPAPWTVRDSMLTALEMFRSMTQNWNLELMGFDLLSGGADPAKVARLLPSRTGLEPSVGSNAWAVSGKHTKTGKPLLASDPHLKLTLPSIWHQVHLQAPGYRVSGVALPGVPGVGIGHNDRIAWGITNLAYDVQDLYAYPGNVGTSAHEVELIRVRGGASVTLRVPLTPRGPVLLSQDGKAFALRWVAAELPQMDYPMIQLNQATNWEQFRQALSRFPGPGFNFVYADVDGNIGYQVAGRLPIRTKTEMVPRDALSTPPDDWKGLIPFDDLPSIYNPPSGHVLTANQNPFPSDYKYPVAGGFAAQYRALRIEERLKSNSQWDPAAFRSLQADNYSAFDRYIAREVARAARGRNDHPRMAEIVRLLEAWDGQMLTDRLEPLVAELSFSKLRRLIAESVAPGKSGRYRGHMSYGVVESLLRERPAGYVKNWDEALVQALKEALEDGAKTYGRDPLKWRWGQFNSVSLTYPIAGTLPVIGPMFRIDAELPGGVATVNQNIEGVGPSMRFVADLSNWNNSTLVLPTGESGMLLSSHLKDQWSIYSNAGSKPLLFDNVKVEKILTLQPAAAR